MKHFILFTILVIVGASAQPLLFIREDAEPYKGHASAIEDAGDQPTVMQPETAAMPVALTSVVCPGGQYRCPDGTTCCKSGTKWACCPYPQAVCCSDKKHCCPHGKTCDLSTSTCKGGDVETDWVPKEAAIPLGAMSEQKTFSVLEEASRNGGKSGEQLIQLVSKVTSSRVKDVPCGGGRSCPDYYLCCPGGQSCCPINYPVCCSDMIHCCQAGTTCVVGGGCSYIQLNWMVKESTSNAKTAASVRQLEGTDISEESAITVGNVPCGGGYSCPDGYTCCKSAGVWKCCPYPQAVCCKDGVHCCPQGNSCGPTSCNSRDFWMELVKKAPARLETKPQNMAGGFVEASPVKQKIVPCPGGQYTCQDGQTCCPKPAGGYGCCTTPNPVCCPDGMHCCPQGKTCDPTSQWCSGGDQIFKAFRKISAGQAP